MNNKKSLWQRMGSLLVALGMVVGIVMPSLPMAWAAEPKPTAINITAPVVMTEGIDLGEVGEVDPVHGGDTAEALDQANGFEGRRHAVRRLKRPARPPGNAITSATIAVPSIRRQSSRPERACSS